VTEFKPEDDERIAKGMQAWELLRMSMTGTVPLRRKRWRKLSPDRTLTGIRPGLERDFTTQGTQGELKCPFSSKIPEIEEPEHVAEVEVAAPDVAPDPKSDGLLRSSQSGYARSKPASNTGSAPQCPIRFLNQIPAEDVAKYFEQHKHEIPRSHEVCVKRYQANEASIRSLDARYGNLVNMIQGLGQKHQPMLPSNLDLEDEAVELDKKSIEKIGKWAENVEGTSADDEATNPDDKSETRTGHFERPLLEVRLGESPSRPWGVRVPYDARLATSIDVPEKESVAAPVQPTTQADSSASPQPKRPAGRCPFGHGALPQESPMKSVLEPEEAPNVSEPVPGEDHASSKPIISEPPLTNAREERIVDDDPRAPRQLITFTGPVFFGYSAEDAAALMRSFAQPQ
jgi:hypothetical protein